MIQRTKFTLERAIEIAKEAHKGQMREGFDEPYVNHPLRVMEAVRDHGENYMIVAVLHDTIEDTWVTEDYLMNEGLSKELVGGIISLTKYDDDSESYEDRVKRAMGNKYGRVVKPADVADNSDETRFVLMSPARADELRNKYKNAKELIKSLS